MKTIKNEYIKTTPISDLGEFALIDRLTKKIKPQHPSVVFGIGDDAAVLKHGKKYQLFSTDLLLEGIHFDLSYTPLVHLGYKLVSVNVSDICAMNGIAKQIVVGLAVSNRFSVESLEELYKGIKIACDNYNIDLVGGDTTSSQTGLMISVSVLGEVEKKNITFRSGAKVNDLLVCTGDLGGAYLGLQLLKREKELFMENPSIQPDLTGNDYLLQRQLRPEAGVKYLEILKELDIVPTSMIDISDGLSSEALHLAKCSDVGVRIYENKLPIDYTALNLAEELKISPITCALNGGEDYELLFTIKQQFYDKIKKDPDFTIVGHITEKIMGNILITSDGSEHELLAQGWSSIKK